MPRGRHAPEQETCGRQVIMGLVARQAKTVPSVVHNSPFASLVLVRRDVMNGGSVRAGR